MREAGMNERGIEAVFKNPNDRLFSLLSPAAVRLGIDLFLRNHPEWRVEAKGSDEDRDGLDKANNTARELLLAALELHDKTLHAGEPPCGTERVNTLAFLAHAMGFGDVVHTVGVAEFLQRFVDRLGTYQLQHEDQLRRKQEAQRRAAEQS
jgi:hypothetical protein